MSWPTKQLGEICDVLDSKRKPVTRKDRIAGKFPYYGATGVLDHVNDYIFDEKLILVGEDGAKWGPGERTAFIAEGKYWVNNHAHVLRPNRDVVLDNWIVYFLNATDLSEYITGVTVPKLNQAKLNQIEIPLPSLEEQRNILKILDEVAESVTLAKEASEKNRDSAAEIFNSYLNKILGDVAQKHGETKLSDVITSVEYGTSAKSKKTGEVAVLRMGNIQNGRFEWDNLVYTDDKEEINKYLLKKNDVLFNRTNSPELVGKTAIYRGEQPAIFAGYLIRIHRNEKLIDAEYLNYFLNSDWAKAYGKKVVISSVNQANINGQKLKGYPIPLPSLAEQKKLTKKLNALSADVDKVCDLYTKKIEALNELQKSVFDKAFAGKLANSFAIPSPYIRNQVHAAIIEQVAKDGGWSTEVAVAKYDHLLQEVYGLSLGYQFADATFGPFDAEIKKLVSSGLGRNRWFTKRRGMVVFGDNVSALLKYQSNLYLSAKSAMNELSQLGITKLDADRVELLSTICHAIKKTGSDTLESVRAYMEKWPTDNDRTKAEKFSEEQTSKCLKFINDNGLQRRLIQTV